MKNIKMLGMCFVAICLIAFNAEAKMVTVASVSSGTYENGKFTPGTGGYSAVYDIDEHAEQIRLDKVIRNNREGREEPTVVYDITNVLVGEGFSALTVSKDKKGQRIFTAVREDAMGMFETLIIGGTSYEYCRAYGGKFYLEYGEVTTGAE